MCTAIFSPSFRFNTISLCGWSDWSFLLSWGFHLSVFSPSLNRFCLPAKPHQFPVLLISIISVLRCSARAKIFSLSFFILVLSVFPSAFQRLLLKPFFLKFTVANFQKTVIFFIMSLCGVFDLLLHSGCFHELSNFL